MRQEVEEKKRKAEEIQEAHELKQIRDEMNKNYEETRDDRIKSWQTFSKNKNKKQKKSTNSGSGFKPPKHKAESRPT